jgi:hypothetical protein
MPSQALVDHLLDVARTAHARGDGLLQLQFEVSQLTGEASAWGSSENAMSPDETVGWILGEVEKTGWMLEHTGFVFVETGSSTSNRVLSTGQGTVTRGGVHGHYVFRRV